MGTLDRASRRAGLGMLGLGIGYFIWYTPYSGLAKGLSGGLLPGVDGKVGGLVLLPASALGMLVAMPVFLLGSGWWRQARTRRIAGRQVPFPRRETAASAFWMALIVGTTTLNFTFAGFSIVFMLVMMRIETILLAPTMDLIRRRRISPYAWGAISLSLASAIVALADVTSYRLSLVAFASLGTYLAGYTGRFEIMSRHAKTGEPVDRRYFVEEHMTTPVIFTLMLAVPALIDSGSAMHALHEGFTSFLSTPAAAYAFVIGICYEGLFIFTTLIFLDRREYAFCMPVHVCASLLAGIAASLGLRFVFGTPPPSTAQIFAAVLVVGAALTLSWPAMRAWWIAFRAPLDERRLVLFVCGGNLARSPMAEAIGRAELDALPARDASGWEVGSAGVAVKRPGAPLSAQAAEALRRLAVPVNGHAARPLADGMWQDSAAIYCMTEAQREAVRTLVDDPTVKVLRLDPNGDIAEPTGDGVDEFLRCAQHIRQQVRLRLHEHVSRPTPRPSTLRRALSALHGSTGDATVRAGTGA